MAKNIYLIGFMGSGKSSVGKLLSEKLSMDYIDIDEFIVENTKMTIPEIFQKAGEAWFREQEAFALDCVSSGENRVIATGGGIVETPANIEKLKSLDNVFFLNAASDRLWSRVGKDENRPLSKNISDFVKLYQKRKPLYKEASSFTIETDRLSVDETAEKIISLNRVGGKIK